MILVNGPASNQWFSNQLGLSSMPVLLVGILATDLTCTSSLKSEIKFHFL